MPPSGSRKKRAARRKKSVQNSPTNPNPNSDPLPPLPLLNNQGNGNSSEPEDEGEGEDEIFETPKGHPDTPIARAVGRFGNRSSSNLLQSDRFPVVAEGSTEKFYTPACAAAAADYNNGSKTSTQELDFDSDENDGLSEMGEENQVVAADNPEDHLVGSEMIGEEVKLDEPSKETVVPMEEPIEFHEAQTGNPDDEPPSVDFEGIPRRGDEGFRDIVSEDSFTEPDEGRVKKLEGLKETNLDEEASKGSNGKVEIANSSAEGRAKELIPVDEALKEIRLENLADEICASVENSTVVTEKVNQRSKATAENLDKSLAGVTSTEERKDREPPPDATARTESSPRTEVARGPLVVRRASLWNCCGLLEVVTGSER